MKILDCTLRDGGYYNKWDFSIDIVNAYLKAMSDANIDIVELGLRNFPKNGFLGAHAYTTESYLNRLELPEGPTYGVMVDAKTILDANVSVEQAIDMLFVESSSSKIKLVRVATHFHELKKSEQIIKLLKAKGYLVGFNLMQSGGKTDEVIEEAAKMITLWQTFDVLYFADSLGNMDADEVHRIIKLLQKHWKGELGIHTHDNMGEGLRNTIVAHESGVSWLDVTVTGMGRGAGNTQTEKLLAILDLDKFGYKSKPVFELVIRYFEKMQRQYGWGSSLLYFLGAQNSVHPTYIQNLLSSSHYGTDEIVGAIEYLSGLESSTSYDDNVFASALSVRSSSKPVEGSEQLVDLFKGKTVLLVANGPSTQDYLSDIETYINENDTITISVNATTCLSSNLIDYYCISHNVKMLAEKPVYQELKRPVILPKHRFSDEEIKLFNSTEVIDYALEVCRSEFEVLSNKCKVPYELTFAYAIACMAVGNAEAVGLVGFDGYEKGDVRQEEMVDVIEQMKLHLNLNIFALTPTTYPLKQSSIYAPVF